MSSPARPEVSITGWCKLERHDEPRDNALFEVAPDLTGFRLAAAGAADLESAFGFRFGLMFSGTHPADGSEESFRYVVGWQYHFYIGGQYAPFGVDARAFDTQIQRMNFYSAMRRRRPGTNPNFVRLRGTPATFRPLYEDDFHIPLDTEGRPDMTKLERIWRRLPLGDPATAHAA